MRTHYQAQATGVIRKLYRRHAGSTEPESPQAAYEKLLPEMLAVVRPLLISAIADGVQMGQGTSFPYKKYAMFDKFDEAFSAKGWREESALIALPFEADADTRVLLERFLKMTSLHIAGITGYSTGVHPIRKIWDVWDLTMHSTATAAYIVGHRLGTQWQAETLRAQEESVLRGILAASEEES
jgi:hypothetical protein